MQTARDAELRTVAKSWRQQQAADKSGGGSGGSNKEQQRGDAWIQQLIRRTKLSEVR